MYALFWCRAGEGGIEKVGHLINFAFALLTTWVRVASSTSAKYDLRKAMAGDVRKGPEI
jgi:hypothetical protein